MGRRAARAFCERILLSYGGLSLLVRMGTGDTRWLEGSGAQGLDEPVRVEARRVGVFNGKLFAAWLVLPLLGV